MSDEVPKPKLILKQPTRDVRVDRTGTVDESRKASAKKAAPPKKTPAKKAAR
jgi:hypothetical protein